MISKKKTIKIHETMKNNFGGNKRWTFCRVRIKFSFCRRGKFAILFGCVSAQNNCHSHCRCCCRCRCCIYNFWIFRIFIFVSLISFIVCSIFFFCVSLSLCRCCLAIADELCYHHPSKWLRMNGKTIAVLPSKFIFKDIHTNSMHISNWTFNKNGKRLVGHLLGGG